MSKMMVEDQRLSMSLDEVVQRSGRKNPRRGTNKSGPVKSNSRNTRRQTPYDGDSQPARRERRDASESAEIAIKFLVSTAIAGAVIGRGGSTIKAFTESTGANVTTSGVGDLYPGTDDRIIQINGDKKAVSRAQTMLWEVIARSSSNPSEDSSWNPGDKITGEFDEVEVEGTIAIPAAAAGLILGAGGQGIRTFAEESGARVAMSAREDAAVTQERLVTVAGTRVACSKFVQRVVSKLAEDPAAAQFIFDRGHYSAQPSARRTSPRATNSTRIVKQEQVQVARGTRRSSGGGGGLNLLLGDGGLGTSAVLSATTTLTLAVPDSLVGTIVGAKGSVLKEIKSLSGGAEVTVSPRGTFVQGTTNRIVTVSGNTASATTAYNLLQQVINQAKAM